MQQPACPTNLPITACFDMQAIHCTEQPTSRWLLCLRLCIPADLLISALSGVHVGRWSVHSARQCSDKRHWGVRRRTARKAFAGFRRPSREGSPSSLPLAPAVPDPPVSEREGLVPTDSTEGHGGRACTQRGTQ